MFNNLKIRISCIMAYIAVIGVIVAMTNTASLAQDKNSLLWGEASSGVQVSISLTSGIVTNQTPFALVVKIRNTQTNTVQIVGINPIDPLLVLTNDAGKGYTISFDYWHNIGMSATSNFKRFEKELVPGEVFEGTLQVKIDKIVDAGNYRLQALQHFITAPGQGVREAASNRLKVVVVKENGHS